MWCMISLLHNSCAGFAVRCELAMRRLRRVDGLFTLGQHRIAGGIGRVSMYTKVQASLRFCFVFFPRPALLSLSNKKYGFVCAEGHARQDGGGIGKGLTRLMERRDSCSSCSGWLERGESRRRKNRPWPVGNEIKGEAGLLQQGLGSKLCFPVALGVATGPE